MHYLKKLFYKIFKRKSVENKWLSYYSEEDKSIKFTKKSIYEYLESQVSNDLDLYALNYFGTRITYGEFLEKIDTVAKSLKFLGVKKGDIVTICLPNIPEAVISFYACNKIGAVADMVHPLSGEKEMLTYLQESKSRILILYDANYSKVSNFLEDTKVFKTILVSVSESMPLPLNVGYKLTKGIGIRKPKSNDHDFITWKDFINLSYGYHKNIEVKVNANDLAIILHSGGTTGIPKGIMISNYNFNAEMQQDGINVINVRPKDKVMTILPVFHGFGLCVCVHCPLVLRVEVILIPEFDSKRFYHILDKYKPQVIAGVPTLWEALLSNKRFDKVDLSKLKYVISGGDYLTIDMEEKMNTFLRKHGANIAITKGYGMTESVAATAYTFQGTNEPGSIGIPMIGNEFCICEPYSTKVLGLGEEGEICVYGPTIMMGYLNNEKETKNVLKKHDDGRVWLHTGDLGYINPKGIIYFTQRLKRVIVSSGFNVYPSQIEEVIMHHPHVKNCCVIGIAHPYKMQVPKAYIVLDEGTKKSKQIINEIKSLCKKDLAAYSQVKDFEFVDSLPKTIYNKIDYRKLERLEAMHEEK